MEKIILATPEEEEILVQLYFQTHKCGASVCKMHFPWSRSPGAGRSAAGQAARRWVCGTARQTNARCTSPELRLVREELLLSVASHGLSCNVGFHWDHLLKYNFSGDKKNWGWVPSQRAPSHVPV